MRDVFKFFRALTRFRRDRSGHAAVEFALVALPFFLLTFGLAEIAMIGFAQTTLDSAVTDVSRRIRTGISQGSGENYTQMQTTLCNDFTSLMSVSCANNLYLDVATFPSFVAIQNTSPIQNGQFQTGGFACNMGVDSSIVVVRAFYRWHIITPMFQSVFANVSGGDRILASTMMFRNEPFGGGGTGAC